MKTVAIIGGGESGVGAAMLAQKNRYEVFVSDFGLIQDKYKSELNINSIPFEEGGHNFERIEQADIIIKSPGIPDKAPLIQYLIAKDIVIISEIEFASRYYNGKIIGVTGSNGKSTTVSLIYHVLHEAQLNVGLAGNIGYAFSRLLLEEKTYEYAVLELSSFQLDNVYDIRVDIGVLLNITADHLDRYNYDIKEYARAKWRLIERVKEDGLIILNSDDQLSSELLKLNSISESLVQISSENPYKSLSKDDGNLFETQLLGQHNAFNVAVCKEVAVQCGLDENQIQDGLLSFKPLEHRLERVSEIEGVTYINDSKATNVDAVKYALSAIDADLIWIAGGTDKGNDYSELRDIIKGRVKLLICLCVDDSKLMDAFENVVPMIVSTQSMKEAVEEAYRYGENGDYVLLSPACASFDLFNNYMHRGDEFKKEVFNINSGIV